MGVIDRILGFYEDIREFNSSNIKDFRGRLKSWIKMGILAGRICEALTTSANAYGTLSLSFDRAQYEIEAFGDSRGDKEMLAFANKGHYKPF